MEEFPQLTTDFVENVKKILSVDVVSKLIRHTWTIDHTFEGFVLSFSDRHYTIYYISESHVGEDYRLDKY